MTIYSKINNFLTHLTLTQHLSNYWSPARFEILPKETVHLAKRFLIDTFAAGIAGHNTEAVEICLAAFSDQVSAGPKNASIWGRPEKVSANLAALINGISTHSLELDDFGGCGHSGAVVIPALSALSEKVPYSGKMAITALVAGYDVAARVLEGAGGYRSINDLGWHSTGICGSFGAAAAGAKILNLNPEDFANALGISGSFTGGIWAFLADGSMTKRIHAGKASENGLCAALFAEKGMSGPSQVLEAQWGGFFSTYAKECATPDLTLKNLGSEFRISRSGMKPYACCRGLHACIDSLLIVMNDKRLSSKDIAAIHIHGNMQYKLQFDRLNITGLLDAQFSIQYALAVAAVSGNGSLSQFIKQRNHEPEIKRLMYSTLVFSNQTLKAGEYPAIEIELVNGSKIKHHTQYAKGAPENPLSDEELITKAISLIDPVLGSSQCSQLLATIWNLEEVKNFNQIIDLLKPSS